MGTDRRLRNSLNTLIYILFSAALIFLLTGCGGKIGSVIINSKESNIFSEREINDAISVVKADFSNSWSGCTLIEIGYAGDEITSETADYYLIRYYSDYSKSWGEFDDVIVLISSFEVDSSGGDGSLNHDSTYTDWNWILVRNDGGAWRHVDHGF